MVGGGDGWKKVGLGASQSWDGHGKGKSAVETLKWNEWKDGEGRNPVNAEIGLNPGCFPPQFR